MPEPHTLPYNGLRLWKVSYDLALYIVSERDTWIIGNEFYVLANTENNALAKAEPLIKRWLGTSFGTGIRAQIQREKDTNRPVIKAKEIKLEDLTTVVKLSDKQDAERFKFRVYLVDADEQVHKM